MDAFAIMKQREFFAGVISIKYNYNGVVFVAME